MSIYNNDKKDYEELFREKMYEAKLMYNLSPEKQHILKKLLIKKGKIKEKNNIFSAFELNIVNKKIEKMQRNKNK